MTTKKYNGKGQVKKNGILRRESINIDSMQPIENHANKERYDKPEMFFGQGLSVSQSFKSTVGLDENGPNGVVLDEPRIQMNR